VLHAFVKVKSQFGIAEETFLLLKEVSQISDDFLPGLNLADCLRFGLSVHLELLFEVFDQTRLLSSQNLDFIQLFVEFGAKLRLKLMFLLVKLVLHVLIRQLLLQSQLRLDILLLAFLHLY